MGKIFRLNKSGTLGVSISKTMKDAGFTTGVVVEWMVAPNGFLLRIVPPKEPETPKVEAPKEEKAADPVELVNPL
jgi:hypothetical protein